MIAILNSLLAVIPLASCHPHIQLWSSSLEAKMTAPQRIYNLHHLTHQEAISNVGWVDTHQEISSDTSQSASHSFLHPVTLPQTISVDSGGKIILILTDDTNKAYQPPQNYIQAYLSFCGNSATSCHSFQPGNAHSFRIQNQKTVMTLLRKQHSSDLGNDLWEAQIPNQIPQGSYILQLETLSPNKSASPEHFQEQSFPSFYQIYISSSHKNNIQKRSQIPKDNSNALANKRHLNYSKSKNHHHSKDVPMCAKRCLWHKVYEAKLLAPKCSSLTVECLCQSQPFVKAYRHCVRDHCAISKQHKAIMPIDKRCKSSSE
ncbi:hypothetical protein O181_062781 [Austropuccinia psidii MF-1]|uniref:AA9 family lytic polysaccharide monooxygenase n=1 Tax=Austropuccinia psidii MF-1 TaxID=1389203 RepID=A0A9Q3EIP5_9BASI|nr:hypothetical protein [Austropuccinia psidii MF-1]